MHMTFESPRQPSWRGRQPSQGIAETGGDDPLSTGPTGSAAVELAECTGYADSVRTGTEPDLQGAVAGLALMSQASTAAPGRTILIAQDDTGDRTALRDYLESSGYQVVEAEDVSSSLRSVFSHTVDLVLLDLERDGGTSDLLTKLRSRSNVPVIVTPGHASEQDRVRLLDLGADDIVAKPFSLAELEARVRAVLRRGNAAPTTTLHFGDFVVDPGTRMVSLREEQITMTRKEFDLLAFLASNPGRVFSREELLERVWGSTSRWQGRSTVTEHIRRVRLKIETDPERPEWIITVRGVGYRFCALAASTNE
jgi:two-component system response regulator ResD